MATPLDTGLFQHFEIIFPFLFVLVVSYAVFSSVKIFGDNKALQAFISFIISVMVLFSPIAMEVINTAAPWFIVLFFFIVFGLLTYMAMGAESADIHKVITSRENSYILILALAVILVIIFGSISYVLAQHGGIGSELTEGSNVTGTDPGAEQESDFWSTLAHPKVLGMVLILLIAVFTMQRLVKD